MYAVVQCAIRCSLARRKLKKLKADAKELGNLKDQNIQLRQEARHWQQQAQALHARVQDLEKQLSTAGVSVQATPPQALVVSEVCTLYGIVFV